MPPMRWYTFSYFFRMSESFDVRTTLSVSQPTGSFFLSLSLSPGMDETLQFTKKQSVAMRNTTVARNFILLKLEKTRAPEKCFQQAPAEELLKAIHCKIFIPAFSALNCFGNATR